ncbi:hypothetical protein CJ195_21855 [Bacillus sp. UMB0899]|uniref:hypothetical protein n=1 Tax=Metabacillus sp. YM-086 TaxID=3341729 RepID=UPI000C808D3F|nr:hypothetical protein CJ195_21855 [Bacillus sp. UMB0899]
MNNKNFFFCYNKAVSDFLKDKGVQFITVAIEPKSQKMFSLYQVDDNLQQALNEYKQQNK